MLYLQVTVLPVEKVSLRRRESDDGETGVNEMQHFQVKTVEAVNEMRHLQIRERHLIGCVLS